MDYMVLYSSKTGNTKKVATEIFSALPGMSKDMQSIDEYRGKEADTFFIGFWVNRGTCDISVIDAMSELHGRKIALFGTCGMSSDAQYYRDIEKKVNVWIPDDCEYLGMFLCQGKMPMQIRQNYEITREDPRQEACRKKLLQNFDEALFHPKDADLAEARAFVERVLGLQKCLK